VCQWLGPIDLARTIDSDIRTPSPDFYGVKKRQINLLKTIELYEYLKSVRQTTSVTPLEKWGVSRPPPSGLMLVRSLLCM